MTSLASSVNWLLGNYKEAVEILVPELPKTTQFDFKKGAFAKKSPLRFLSFSVTFLWQHFDSNCSWQRILWCGKCSAL